MGLGTGLIQTAQNAHYIVKGMAVEFYVVFVKAEKERSF